MAYCSSCGSPALENAGFCAQCGTHLIAAASAPKNTNGTISTKQERYDKRQKSLAYVVVAAVAVIIMGMVIASIAGHGTSRHSFPNSSSGDTTVNDSTLGADEKDDLISGKVTQDTKRTSDGLTFHINSVHPNPDGKELSLKAEGLCAEVTRYLNALVDYTDTTCLPAASSNTGRIDLILISSQPLFSVEPSKKGWLIGVAGVVGKVMSDHTQMKLEEIWVTDTRLIAKRRAFKFPAALAQKLQRETKGGEITLEQLYDQLSGALKGVAVPN